MTIISLETKASHRRVSSAKPSTRPVLPLGIVAPGPESTTLVQDFILSFKELESYKWVYVHLKTLHQVYLFWNFRQGMENQSS